MIKTMSGRCDASGLAWTADTEEAIHSAAVMKRVIPAPQIFSQK
jgi:hypothetical protein